MSVFAKFTIKSVVRRVSLTPTEARRQKLVSAINEQLEAAEAASRGEPYSVTVPRWTENEKGERVRVERQLRMARHVGDTLNCAGLRANNRKSIGTAEEFCAHVVRCMHIGVCCSTLFPPYLCMDPAMFVPNRRLFLTWLGVYLRVMPP